MGVSDRSDPATDTNEPSATLQPRGPKERTPWCVGSKHERKGELLGDRYRIVRKIGEGGMGEVYEATHIGLGRRVAIKLLHEVNRRRSRYLERFAREARTLASVSSEHVVLVTDSGESDDGLPFIVMEYLEGRDLRQLLRQHPVLPPLRAVKIVLEACEGVRVAHTQGLVHRDLKPENLFLVSRAGGVDFCKVLDFGVAKQREASTLTRDGALVGTAQYMAPEQALGRKDLDGRVDVFALGCILYECLAGEAAFQGDKPEAILYAILHRDPVPLSHLNPEVPKLLAQVVHRALARNPDERYQKVLELSAALRQVEAFLRAQTPGTDSPGTSAASEASTFDASEGTRDGSDSYASLQPLAIGAVPATSTLQKERWPQTARLVAAVLVSLVAGTLLASLMLPKTDLAPPVLDATNTSANGTSIAQHALAATQPIARSPVDKPDPDTTAKALPTPEHAAPPAATPTRPGPTPRRALKDTWSNAHQGAPFMPAAETIANAGNDSGLDLAPNPYR